MCIPCNLSTTKTHLLFLVLTCSFTATIWAAEGSSVVDVSAALDRKSAIQAYEKIPIIDFEDTPPPPSLLERSFQFFKPDLEWLSNSQKKVTYGVEVTARSIDNFFAGEESLELHNYSFLRIRLQPGFRRNHDDQFDTSPKCIAALICCGLVVGLLSGLFGVGGGFLIVPALLFITQVSMRQAVATSLLIICVVGGTGFASFVHPMTQWIGCYLLRFVVAACWACWGDA